MTKFHRYHVIYWFDLWIPLLFKMNPSAGRNPTDDDTRPSESVPIQQRKGMLNVTRILPETKLCSQPEG